jgi:nucleotide-binding universal stress UspA family protein
VSVTKPIIVGYDPTTADHAPVEFGLAISRLTGARLIVVSVQAGPPVLAVGTATPGVAAVVQAPDRDLVADCTEALDALADELASQGAVECRKLQGTSAARALHEAAEAEHAGLLVVGSSRRGPLGKIVTGSTAARLLPGAPCPVAVVPRGWNARGAIATIGVAYNDREAREALRAAHALARAAGATLRVLTVVEPGPAFYLETEPRTAVRPGKDVTAVEGEARVEAEERLRAAVAELSEDVPTHVDAFIGDPAEVLIELSERLDLLVCGSRGYGPLRAVMLGSVTRRVASEAGCPVIVLARGIETPLEELLAESEPAASPT